MTSLFSTLRIATFVFASRPTKLPKTLHPSLLLNYLLSISKMSTLADIVPPGVVTGDNLVKLLDHARSNGYAIRKFWASSTCYRTCFCAAMRQMNVLIYCCGFEFALVGHERIRFLQKDLIRRGKYCAYIFLFHFTSLIMHHITSHIIQCSIDLSTRCARPRQIPRTVPAHQPQPPSIAPLPRPSTPASRPPRSTTVPS